MPDYLKRIAGLCLPLLLATLLTVPLLADDDDEDEGAPESVSEMSMTAQDTALDSIYALINESFAPVQPILKRSCYDCHSTETEYPWYHSLPLIKGVMDDHIKEGREHLDMTDGFPFKGEDSPRELLENIRKEIEKNDMPILSYRLMHWGLLIEGPRRDTVFGWIDSSLALLKQQ